ncbi:MAG: 50S ribosomal protein L6 [Bacilli bacterium]|nr:50S ribosomal protein L6 [Bacilli bacterium]
MSRIGNRVLTIPAGVTVTLDGNNIKVTGPKGTLEDTVNSNITVSVEGDKLSTSRNSEIKSVKQIHGTTNANIANMLAGVSEGYKIDLEIVGVGYRCQVAGKKITLNVGYSHPVVMDAPEGITVTSEGPTQLTVSGIDKQKVSEFAAKIRENRLPEPYKGKGIRYKDEHIRRKEGKKASK